MYELLLQKVTSDNIFVTDVYEQLFANFQRLIVSLVALYWVYPFLDSLLFPYERDWELWQIAALLSLSSIVCFRLVRRSFFLAFLVYELTLFSVLSLSILVTANTALLWFYIVLPMLAFLLSGWRIGILSLLTLYLSLLWLANFAGQATLDTSNIAWLMLLAAFLCAGIILVLDPLIALLDWSATYYQSTQDDLSIARQDRATVRRTLHTVNHSIRSLERANSELIVSQQNAEEAERFKTQFVRHLSHEFRTPLNLILGFTDVMINSPESYGVDLPRQYRSDMRALHRSSQHLLELVNEVLDLARIETGNVSIVPSLIAVPQLIEEVSAMMKSHIISKGLAFDVHCPDDLPLAYLDAVRIRQALLNLLSNAVRFTETGSISLAVTKHGSQLRFEVTDTGCGIAKEDLGKIFRPFNTRAHGRTWYSGTGLGLSITKQLIELHHGQIGLHSAVGSGTSFWFTLPIKARHDENHPLAEKRLTFSTRDSYHLSRQIIIVYHENIYLVAFLKASLNHYDVIQAHSWEDTVSLATSLRAVAVIVSTGDIQGTLPESILLINFPFPSDEQYTADERIKGVLVKPFSRIEIQLLIERSERSINRILVVDDDPDIVRLVRRILYSEVAASDILSAHNGIEALEMIAIHKPDMIFLDMLMPELDGQGLLDRIEKNKNYADIAIVLMSATHSRLEDAPIKGLLQLQVRFDSPFYELIALIHQTLSVWV